MADEPTQVPSPQFPPEVTTLPPQESHARSIRHKAMISTGLVALVAIGIIAFDPFHFFTFDVSRNRASEETPTPTQRAYTIQATCAGSVATVTWSSIPNAQVNGLERSIGTGPYEVIYFEGGDYPFQTFEFRDNSVQSGQTYTYRVISGIGVQPAATVTCQ